MEKVLFKNSLNNVYQNKLSSEVDGVIVYELFCCIREKKEEMLYKKRNCKYKLQSLRRVYILKENSKLRKQFSYFKFLFYLIN